MEAYLRLEQRERTSWCRNDNVGIVRQLCPDQSLKTCIFEEMSKRLTYF